jgi:hypothetical protein
MKKALLAVAALTCMGSAALAGPNADGTLIAALSVGTVYTTDNTGYCGSVTTPDCGSAVTTQDTGTAVINVLAAFPGNGRLAGLTFGVNYPDAEIFIAEAGSCGDFELPTGDWPGDGSGTAVTWSTAVVAQLIECYWIAAYSYYGNPGAIALGPHPTQGGQFADDSVPSQIDDITCFGAFGFAGDPGFLCCPPTGPRTGACCFADGTCQDLFEADCDALGGSFQGEGTDCMTTDCPLPTGACCIPGASCVELTRDDCAAQGGNYQGDGTDCDPDPCPTPTIDSSWGEIKNNYR